MEKENRTLVVLCANWKRVYGNI